MTDSSEADRVVHRFAEPERKAWAKRFFFAMSTGLMLIPALGAYLLFLEGDTSLAAMMAFGAVPIGLFLAGVYLRQARIGPTVLLESGVRLSLGMRKQKRVVVPYGRIKAVRVPGPFQSIRLYRIITSDGKRFVIDGWIEHDFIERLRAQLGDRWDSVYKPRKGRYSVWPPQR